MPEWHFSFLLITPYWFHKQLTQTYVYLQLLYIFLTFSIISLKKIFHLQQRIFEMLSISSVTIHSSHFINYTVITQSKFERQNCVMLSKFYDDKKLKTKWQSLIVIPVRDSSRHAYIPCTSLIHQSAWFSVIWRYSWWYKGIDEDVLINAHVNQKISFSRCGSGLGEEPPNETCLGS